MEKYIFVAIAFGFIISDLFFFKVGDEESNQLKKGISNHALRRNHPQTSDSETENIIKRTQ